MNMNLSNVELRIVLDLNSTSSVESCRSHNASLDVLYQCMQPTVYEWILIIAYCGIFVTGIVGNSLVCFAVWRNRAMRKVTNVFMVNLSVADLMVLVVVLPPMLLNDVTGTWFLGNVMCKITSAVATMCISVSVMTLMAISIERWHAICHPLKSRTTVRRARIIIVLTWLISALLSIPELLASGTTQPRADTVIYTMCYPKKWKLNDVIRLQVCFMVGLYAVPLLLMACAYTNISLMLWRSGVSDNGSSKINQTMLAKKGQEKSTRLANRKRAAKMLIIVFVVFALCFLPNHILNILRYMGKLHEMPNVHIFALLAHWSVFFNSCINPVIYNFMSDRFRKEFKVAVLLCLHCDKNKGPLRQDTGRSHTTYAGNRRLTFQFSNTTFGYGIGHF